MEYVNQLEKYTRPDIVENDRRCDLCGERYIDTQEKLVTLMESDSYLSTTSGEVEKHLGEQDITLSSYNRDKDPYMAFGKQSDSKVIQSMS